MDIGPTELPILPVRPSEGIRRVEGRTDAQQYPKRRQPNEEQPEEGEHEAPHDRVDVSATYRLAHPEPAETELGEPSLADTEGAALLPHIDIEA